MCIEKVYFKIRRLKKFCLIQISYNLGKLANYTLRNCLLRNQCYFSIMILNMVFQAGVKGVIFSHTVYEYYDTFTLMPPLEPIGEGNGTPVQYSCLENPWTEEPGRLLSVGLLGVGHE